MGLSRILLALLFVVVLFGEGQAQTGGSSPCMKDQIVRRDGVCWNSLSVDSKYGTIRGIWTGLKLRGIADDFLDKQPLYFETEWSNDKDWAATPQLTTIGDISGYFDLLYKTPANRIIQWEWAYILAAMNGREDDSDDRLSLLRLLREHGSLPTFAELISVKAADKITVRTNNKTFDIQLAGLSDVGLSPANRERAMSFLRGLTSTGYDCKEAKRTSVTLVYGSEMFRGENQLSATVRISGPLICLDDKEVSINALYDSDVAFLDINSFMLSRGLINLDSAIDPKWPESVRKFRLNDRSFFGKTRQVYLYGSNTIPNVDAIIAHGAKQSRARNPSAAAQTAPAPVESKVTSGSGFFIAPSLAVTNQHVVNACSNPVGTTVDKRSERGRVIAQDSDNDVALIQFSPTFSAPAIAVFREGKGVQAGEAITLAGFPLAGILASGASVSAGIVSNLAGPNNDTRILQISAPVQPGNSGGPVLDQAGRLVGIVVAKLDAIAMIKLTGDIPQNVNFAVKESVLRTFLDTHNIDYQFKFVTQPPASVGALAQMMSIFVECK